MMSNIF